MHNENTINKCHFTLFVFLLSTAGAEPTASSSYRPGVAALHTGSTQGVALTPMYINFTQWKTTVEISGLFTPGIFQYKPFLFLTLSWEVFCKTGVFFYNLLSWGDYELWVFVCYQIALIFWIMHSYLKREGESRIKNKRLFFSCIPFYYYYTLFSSTFLGYYPV